MQLARRGKPSSDGILTAAERVFAKTGYGQTSLRAVIAAAGVSTTAFYARFPSKDAVLEALVQRMMTDLAVDAARSLREATDVRNSFDISVDVVVRKLIGHRALIRVAMTECGSSAGTRMVLQNAYAALVQLVRSRIDTMIERGHIPKLDSEAVSWGLVGALKMHLWRWAVFEEIDDAALATNLRATAHALLPALGGGPNVEG
jgi:AcrR family transcriptional regulator